jgi:hypothetical protein
MCTVLLPTGVNPNAVKYIIYHTQISDPFSKDVGIFDVKKTAFVPLFVCLTAPSSL